VFCNIRSKPTSTSSYSIIRRRYHAVIRCYTPHTVDKMALNQESASWDCVAPTALFGVCHKEYIQCFDRSSRLDCPVRNHWQNDREACRLLICNAKYTGRISPTFEKRILLSSAWYECGSGTVYTFGGFSNLFRNTGTTTQGTVSSTITAVTTSNVAEPCRFVLLVYVQIQLLLTGNVKVYLLTMNLLSFIC